MKTMDKFEILAPCHFGLEAVLKREIYDLGYEISRVEDGHVAFWGDPEAIAMANVHLRCAERVLLVVGRFKATTFEELFQGILALSWEKYVPLNGRFWVTKATSVKSKLFSGPDIQSVAKKAMVRRMQKTYDLEYFPEDGADYPVRIFLYKDEVTVTLDTTGVPLHKRGYRTMTSKAPLSETLAAALLMLTPWRADRILLDPFCGSGTFLIEAAMMAANIAPGARRAFTAEQWTNLMDPKLWEEVKEDAIACEDTGVETNLSGFDLDADMVRIARINAKQAGVDHMIHFQQRDAEETRHPGKYGFIVTNPPYGERIAEQKDLPQLYGKLQTVMERLNTWSLYVITSYEDAQKYIGRKADRNRKIYNGMIKTYFYQYPGPKPPRKKS
ncbi:putative N6-adenine-specific DNA methylase [Lachnospiraceae bacterium C10]|nr:putative N6-adenine-specific DNA methylase [Lachnospiraceae bacterium C10]